MHETSFFFLFGVCYVLVLAHQAVCVAITGKTGWEHMVCVAPAFLTRNQAIAIVAAWTVLTTSVTAAIWYVIPMWVMIPVLVLGEAVAIWQLRKIASKA